jgi:hypothetical protein
MEARNDVQDYARNGQPETQRKLQLWPEYKPLCTQFED